MIKLGAVRVKTTNDRLLEIDYSDTEAVKKIISSWGMVEKLAEGGDTVSLILFMTWGTGIDQEMRLILPLSPECYQVRSIKGCTSLIRDIMILTQKRLY